MHEYWTSAADAALQRQDAHADDGRFINSTHLPSYSAAAWQPEMNHVGAQPMAAGRWRAAVSSPCLPGLHCNQHFFDARQRPCWHLGSIDWRWYSPPNDFAQRCNIGHFGCNRSWC